MRPTTPVVSITEATCDLMQNTAAVVHRLRAAADQDAVAERITELEEAFRAFHLGLVSLMGRPDADAWAERCWTNAPSVAAEQSARRR